MDLYANRNIKITKNAIINNRYFSTSAYVGNNDKQHLHIAPISLKEVIKQPQKFAVLDIETVKATTKQLKNLLKEGAQSQIRDEQLPFIVSVTSMLGSKLFINNPKAADAGDSENKLKNNLPNL